MLTVFLPHLNRTVSEKDTVSSKELYDTNDQDPSELHDYFFDPDCFDFNKWKKCMNKVMTESSSSLFLRVILRVNLSSDMRSPGTFTCPEV